MDAERHEYDEGEVMEMQGVAEGTSEGRIAVAELQNTQTLRSSGSVEKWGGFGVLIIVLLILFVVYG